MVPGNTAAPDYGSALDALDRVYQELDQELDTLEPRCQASGRCCDFVSGGYILYASELEFRKARLVVGLPGPWPLTRSGECPFLTPGGKCSIHPARPLGCRTYFCDPDYRPKEPEVYQKFRDKIAEISERHNLPWDYRPFHGPSGIRAIKEPDRFTGTRGANDLDASSDAGSGNG